MSADLSLLEQVEFKFALADTNEKLQVCINQFLAAMLLKLDSEDQAVRDRVISIVDHLKARLNNSIVLPLAQLVQLYAKGKSLLLKSISLIFVDIGWNRVIDSTLKQKLLPLLVIGLSSADSSLRNRLFRIIVLHSLCADPSVELSALFSNDFALDKVDLEHLFRWLIVFIMYYKVRLPSMQQIALNASTRGLLNSQGQQLQITRQPDGLSLRDVNLITDGEANGIDRSYQHLTNLKLKLLSNVFKIQSADGVGKSNDNDVMNDNLLIAQQMNYVIAVIGSIDGNHEVQALCEEYRKRNLAKLKSYSVVTGQMLSLCAQRPQGLEDAFCRISTQLFVKLMNELCRFKIAKEQYLIAVNVIQMLVDDGLIRGNDKAFQSIVAFARHFVSGCEDSAVLQSIYQMAMGILQNENAKVGEDLLGFAFQIIAQIGSLGDQKSVIDSKGIQDFIQLCFDRLSIANKDLKQQIMLSISQISEIVEDSQELQDTISTRYCMSENENVRLSAFRLAERIFEDTTDKKYLLGVAGTVDDNAEVVKISLNFLKFAKNVKCDVPSVLQVLSRTFSNDDANLNSKDNGVSETVKHKAIGQASQLIIWLLLFIVDKNVVLSQCQFGQDGVLLEDLNLSTLESNEQDIQRLRSLISSNQNASIRQQFQSVSDFISAILTSIDERHSGATVVAVLDSFYLLLLLRNGELLPAVMKIIEVLLNIERKFKSNGKVCAKLSLCFCHVIAVLGIDFFKSMQSNAQISERTQVFAFRNLVYMYGVELVQQNYSLLFQSINRTLTDNMKSNYSADNITLLAESWRFGMSDGDLASVSAIVDTTLTQLKVTENTSLLMAHIDLLLSICFSSTDMGLKIMEETLKVVNQWNKDDDLLYKWSCMMISALFGHQSRYAQQFQIYCDEKGDTLSPISWGRTIVSETAQSQIVKVLDQHITSESSTAAIKRPMLIFMLALARFAPRVQLQELQTELLQSLLHLAGIRELADLSLTGLSLLHNNLVDSSEQSDLFNQIQVLLTKAADRPSPLVSKLSKFELKTSFLAVIRELVQFSLDISASHMFFDLAALSSDPIGLQSNLSSSLLVGQMLNQSRIRLLNCQPQLVPKLYCMTFDANNQVKQAMKRLWNNLFESKQKITQQFFSDVVNQVIHGLQSDSWRLREASAFAVQDLLIMHSVDSFSPYLNQIWSMCLVCLEDDKESVRIAAFGILKCLLSVCVKQICDEAVSLNEKKRLISLLLPFLLKALGHNYSADAQKVCLDALRQLCKQVSPLLCLYCAEIIHLLVSKLTELEPQQVNYLSFHTEKYGITEQQLNSARSSAVKQSSLMTIIEQCAAGALVDENADEVFVKLADLVRRGVGLPTKVGTFRVIQFIVLKHQNIVKSHESSLDTLLKALSGTVGDNDDIVRQSVAVCVGYLFKYCSLDVQKKFVKHLKTLYVERDSTPSKHGASLCILEISKHSSLCVQSHPLLTALTYFGMGDAHLEKSQLFKQIWNDQSVSVEGALNSCTPDLVDILKIAGTSTKWDMRAQAGSVIAQLLEQSKFLDSDTSSTLAELTVSNLSGPIFSGKEKYHLALAQLLCKVGLSSNSKQFLDYEQLLLKECSRGGFQYRTSAYQSLEFHLSSGMLSNQTIPSVIDLCSDVQQQQNQSANVDDMDVQSGSFSDLVVFSFKCAVALLCYEYAYSEPVVNLLCNDLQNSSFKWDVHFELLQYVNQQVSRGLKAALDGSMIMNVIQSVSAHLTNSKHLTLREQSLGVIRGLLAMGQSKLSEEQIAQCRTLLQLAVSQESSLMLKQQINDAVSQLSNQ
ncbi:hypothetical protein MIR68_001562 [Amoeboaphelidium protococcarum]|nr:hypothetical protein MIR68_001562 [Amoeboaphelidium protococcarum]